jgi:hypothetical protein
VGRCAQVPYEARPPDAALPSQIDSFELLYYYDEYLGHCLW